MKFVLCVLVLLVVLGYLKYSAMPTLPSAEDINLVGTPMGGDKFIECVDKVWPERKLNNEMKMRYFEHANRISEVCRRYGEPPAFDALKVCCKPGKD